MRDALGEEESGERFVARSDFGGRAVGEQFAAVDAGGGTEIDDAVGARHELVVVLDDEQRVALRAQRLEGANELFVVARVQPDARFVEHVENAGKIGAELRGEPDALGLAAGQRLGRAVEREVAEADVREELQALLDLRHGCPAQSAGRGDRGRARGG
jgi:hypothetical protein